jgi:hypothetical protein
MSSSNTTWSESTITYNTRLSPTGVVHGTGTVSGTTGTWYEVDLTGFLQQQKAAGATAVTFVLRAASPSNSTILFDSDEGVSQPELVVVS